MNWLHNSLQKRNVFVWIGLACTLIGALLLVRTCIFMARSVPVVATVVDMRIVESPSSSDRVSTDTRVYYPTLQFTDTTGQTQTIVSQIGSSGYTYRVGNQVRARYLPHNPTHVRIEGFMSMWSLSLCFFIVGLFLTGLGLLWNRALRLHLQKQQEIDHSQPNDGATLN